MTDGPLPSPATAEAAQWLYMMIGNPPDRTLRIVAWDPSTATLHDTGHVTASKVALHPSQPVIAYEGTSGVYTLTLGTDAPRLLYRPPDDAFVNSTVPMRWTDNNTVGFVLRRSVGAAVLVDATTGVARTYQVPYPDLRTPAAYPPPYYNQSMTRVALMDTSSLYDNGILVWDVQTGAPLLARALEGVTPFSSAYSWVGREDAFGVFDATALAWGLADVATDTWRPWLVPPAELSPPDYAILFLPNVHQASGRVALMMLAGPQRRAAGASRLQLVTWDDGTFTLTCLTSNDNTIRADDNRNGLDSTLAAWDATGTRLALSAFGEVAGGNERGILVLDVLSGQVVRALSAEPEVYFEVVGWSAPMR